ncbi:hypothetical protein [Pseudolysinimonas yzui]|uniref:Leucine-rich repeat domain-containing protein n=1 Tax=Pseudolysinimonas yzui TaxID=2708254 RepID=A0A8J3GNV4_9MICO|nr:hypothetical protein [Pseudolysinimonas yzui]GHF08585.1 hypothetical protein GCM10011600_06790 [Pseudolysinimonas yzui]
MSSGETANDELRITGRVSQVEFEESVRGYRGAALVVEDARSLSSLEPLRGLTEIETLMIDGPFAILDLSPLETLSAVRHIRYGNADLGNDKTVAIRELGWVRSLRSLEKLELIGVRLLEPDLSPLLEVPLLRELSLPLRRAYRRTVFAYADANVAFRQLADSYRGLDDFRETNGLPAQ